MASQKTNDGKPLESFTLQWRAAWKGGGGRGSFKRQAELEKAFTEKARQEPRQPGKTEGQLPAPPFACAAASWHVSTPEREEPNQPPDSPTPAALGPGAPLSSPKPL